MLQQDTIFIYTIGTTSPPLQLIHPLLQLPVPVLQRLDTFPEPILRRLASLDEPILSVKVLGKLVEGSEGGGEGGMGIRAEGIGRGQERIGLSVASDEHSQTLMPITSPFTTSPCLGVDRSISSSRFRFPTPSSTAPLNRSVNDVPSPDFPSLDAAP